MWSDDDHLTTLDSLVDCQPIVPVPRVTHANGLKVMRQRNCGEHYRKSIKLLGNYRARVSIFVYCPIWSSRTVRQTGAQIVSDGAQLEPICMPGRLVRALSPILESFVSSSRHQLVARSEFVKIRHHNHWMVYYFGTTTRLCTKTVTSVQHGHGCAWQWRKTHGQFVCSRINLTRRQKLSICWHFDRRHGAIKRQ